jgi:hydrogenase maturation protease
MAHAPQPSKSLVVGIGNEQRGDDAAGLLVVRRVRALGGAGQADIAEHPGDGAGLIDLWQRYDRVIVVDALDGTLDAGFAWFDVSTARASFATGAASTHAIGLSQAVEMARALGLLPRRIEICAVAGRHFEPFASVSTEVERTCAAAAVSVLERLHGQHLAARPEENEAPCTR